VRRKRCPYCRGLFIPDTRVGSRHKVCRKNECQARRKKESQRKWSEKHRDYWGIHQVKDESRKAFRAEKAAYMREYRRRHPEYVKQDNERRNRGRSGEKPSGEGVRRNQDERFAQIKEIKRLVVELLPCRNQDVICGQMAEKTRVTCHLPAP
jgi:hypothetical protein